MARTTKQPHGGAVNTFEKGDPGGPGRPPLLLSTIVAELRAQGYERATAGTVAVQLAPISNLKANPTNPRVLRDEKFLKLKKSIQDFPDMLNYRGIVAVTDTDGKFMVLGGNMRLRALQDLGIKEVPVMLADHWTEEQRREFIIKDNVGFGEWDWDALANEWDGEQLQEWGLDLPKDPIEGGDDETDYTPEFRLVIECTSEAQQQQYFKEITNLGIECKPLTL